MAVSSVALLSPTYSVAWAQETATQPALPDEQAPKIPNDQLDSLVAPIALYPDPLLSQTLVASTYPLEIVQLQQWMAKNEDLKGKALADAVEKQPWDPSIQSMAIVPDVVKQLGENIAWTSELGNAFSAQNRRDGRSPTDAQEGSRARNLKSTERATGGRNSAGCEGQDASS